MNVGTTATYILEVLPTTSLSSCSYRVKSYLVTVTGATGIGSSHSLTNQQHSTAHHSTETCKRGVNPTTSA